MKTTELNPSRSMLQQLRERHPIKCGDIIDGKRVVETCYKMDGDDHVPVYRLEGEFEHRKISSP